MPNMGYNKEEYNALRKLRDALYAKQTALNKIAEVEKCNQQYKSVQKPKESECRVTTMQNALKNAYNNAKQAEIRKDEFIKRKGINKPIMVAWIIACVLVSIIGIILTVLVAIWSWNGSISALLEKTFFGSNLEHGEAVGVHMFALTVLLVIAAIVAHKLCADDYFEPTVPIIVILSIISAIISMINYYGCSHGFFSKIGAFFVSIVLIPHFFIALIRWIPFFIVLIGFGALAIWFGCLATSRYDKIHYGYEKNYSINYQPLYDSKEYKNAESKDSEATHDIYQASLVAYEKQKEIADKQLVINNKTLVDLRAVIDECNKVIRGSTFINTTYHNLHDINTILYYFEYNRADTIKEAINLHIQYLRYKEIYDKLDQIQMTFVDTINNGVNTICKKLNQLENTVSTEIGSLSKAVTSQNNAIIDTMDKISEENKKNTDRIIDRYNDSIRNQMRSIELQGQTLARLNRINETLYYK